MFYNVIIEPLQTTFAYKGCKITAEKTRCFSANFALLARFFLVSVLLSASVKRCFVSCITDFQCLNQSEIGQQLFLKSSV